MELRTERVYNLKPFAGDYNTLRISNTKEIDDDMPELVRDGERFLQFLEVERAFFKYLELYKLLGQLPPEEAISQIDDLRIRVYQKMADSLLETKSEEKGE